MMPRWIAKQRRKLGLLLALILAPTAAHVVIGHVARIAPPSITAARVVAESAEGGARRTPRGWLVDRGVRMAYLAGSPEEIGAQHTALLYDRMVADEKILWDGFEQLVPFTPARTLMFDIGRMRYRTVLDGFPDARARELAAEALGFSPDPYASRLPTFQRLVMLHALYDISLGFEGSPLLGCTAFGLGPELTSSGHTLFARAFDFEATDVFDRDKVVFVVHEQGRIPFASVAWPGFVGVVTGMNAQGVAVAAHGGRARDPSVHGVPVPFSLREVLASAKNTTEAIAILEKQPVMVSHLVIVADASGRFAVVERAPGLPAHVRTSFAREGAATLTNHFEGPLAGDPRDETVRKTTTTLARRSRIDELVAAIPPKSASVGDALAILRDHGCTGAACPLGDRRAIDAFIATHGIVADLTERTLWVSAGPHLSGRFIKLDPTLLEPPVDGKVPEPPLEVETLPEDPALNDGRYERGRAHAGGPLMHPRRPRAPGPTGQPGGAP